MLRSVASTGRRQVCFGLRRDISALASVRGAKPAAGAPGTVVALVDSAVERFEHRDALVAPTENVKFTYAECRKHTDAYTHGMAEQRVRAGDGVGMLFNNATEPLLVSVALMAAGAVVHLGNDAALAADKLGPLLSGRQLRALVVPASGVERVVETVPEYASRPYSTPLQSAAFPSLLFVAQAGLARHGAMYTLRDVPVYEPLPSRVPALKAAIDGSTPALSLVSTPLANAGAPAAALSHAELAGGAVALADALALTKADRVCFAATGGDGGSLVLQLAVVHTGAASIVVEQPATLAATLAAQHCNVLVLSAPALADVSVDALPDAVGRIVLLGDASLIDAGKASALEAAGKQLFSLPTL
eukprot:TRINITY_DN2554_c0_g1_i1.p1 TRINITY_DN2554_c0_g1~~TRINITY_DN2554_c0_g1_i1.p1  ORF type:complete len:376 (+),score=243.04 TRINITY_DN2554_c0_g1_i1:49-1128(+)